MEATPLLSVGAIRTNESDVAAIVADAADAPDAQLVNAFDTVSIGIQRSSDGKALACRSEDCWFDSAAPASLDKCDGGNQESDSKSDLDVTKDRILRGAASFA